MQFYVIVQFNFTCFIKVTMNALWHARQIIVFEYVLIQISKTIMTERAELTMVSLLKIKFLIFLNNNLNLD